MTARTDPECTARPTAVAVSGDGQIARFACQSHYAAITEMVTAMGHGNASAYTAGARTSDFWCEFSADQALLATEILTVAAGPL